EKRSRKRGLGGEDWVYGFAPRVSAFFVFEGSATGDPRHKLRNAGLVFAANRETLAGFSPQTAKPESLRRSTPETGVRYISINKTVASSSPKSFRQPVFESLGVRIEGST